MFVVSVYIICTGISGPYYPQIDGYLSVDISNDGFTKIPRQTSGSIRGSAGTDRQTAGGREGGREA